MDHFLKLAHSIVSSALYSPPMKIVLQININFASQSKNRLMNDMAGDGITEA